MRSDAHGPELLLDRVRDGLADVRRALEVREAVDRVLDVRPAGVFVEAEARVAVRVSGEGVRGDLDVVGPDRQARDDVADRRDQGRPVFADRARAVQDERDVHRLR